MGRLLGLGVIVLAMSVLAVGAMAFLNAPSGSPRPRTPTPNPLVTPAATFGAEASPPPGSSPSAAAPSAEPSPSATPFEPTVQVGPGFVTFGTQAGESVTIKDPRATFQVSETIRWSAYLSQPVESLDMTVRVLKLDAASESGERLISEAPVHPISIGNVRFGRRIEPERALDGPGIYIVRYLRGETVMSQGYFLLTE